jgi:RNA polymerase sigma-54 factor
MLCYNLVKVDNKMKTKLVQTLKPTHKINIKQVQSLAILVMNQQELDKLIFETAQQNPLLEIHPDYYHQTIELNEELLNNTNEISLIEELVSQINTSKYKNKECAKAIIHHLDSNGYCTTSLIDIKKESHFKLQDCKDALQFIQTLYPLGVGARDLEECLTIQCKHINTQHQDILLKTIHYLNDLAKGHFLKIAKILNTIKTCLKLIQTCNPKPASNYSASAPMILPEIFIINDDGELSIQTRDCTQYLKINNDYMNIDDKETKDYLKIQAKSLKQLLSSIHKRNSTLNTIANMLIQIQKEAIINDEPLKPLTYKQISDVLNCNPSTVFRSIQNKALQYESKTILLSSLFTNESKDGLSSDYIKTFIKKIISNENKSCPLSDEQIRLHLQEQQINISRRTIMKYREQLRIPNSSRRKVNL